MADENAPAPPPGGLQEPAAAAAPTPPLDDEPAKPPAASTAFLSLAALGIIYGDIGTSPLYAVRESFSGHFGIAPTTQSVLGVLSLITWTLIVLVCVKYLGIVLRADNHGEGGILALTALVRLPDLERPRRRGWLVAVGLFGAALLFADGVLTPAISVLSAVEGLEVAAPHLGSLVMPLTIGILVGLFAFQRLGTARVGTFFGPITLVWFATLAALGVRGILMHPAVLAALNPLHALQFLASHGLAGFLVLGAVFLVATGSETLYADLGHFGRRPIRLSWFVVVFPALLLNYFGQGALVLASPDAVVNPFYLLAPGWGRVGLLVLATVATIIASQAVITGVFSLTMQAVQLGYWPRTGVQHTSAVAIGQVYVPAANWLLMVTVVLVVLGFGSSAAVAGAYGLSIVCTMIVTTLLLFVVAPRRFGWPKVAVGFVLGSFLAVELGFLGANLFKVSEGGWFPLAVAGFLFLMMTTWRAGRRALGERLRQQLVPWDKFLESFPNRALVRVAGNAVYMTGNPGSVPPAMIKNIEHQHTLHKRVLLLTIATERVPHVDSAERLSVDSLPFGFFRVTARYGFLETPDVRRILRRLAMHGLEMPLSQTTFFLGRERPVSATQAPLARGRVALFSWMVRNSQRATAYFNIPPDRVVEVGSQIEM